MMQCQFGQDDIDFDKLREDFLPFAYAKEMKNLREDFLRKSKGYADLAESVKVTIDKLETPHV